MLKFCGSVFKLIVWKCAAGVVGLFVTLFSSPRHRWSDEDEDQVQSILEPLTEFAFEPPPSRYANTVAEVGCLVLSLVAAFLVLIAFPSSF